MPHPKTNLSYVGTDVIAIEPRTGGFTASGMLLLRTLNGILDRLGGITAQALPLRNYTVATLPDATVHDYGLIFVTNETGGATVAFSDGTNWRRVQDRAIVS
jgi:hypothetical protein